MSDLVSNTASTSLSDGFITHPTKTRTKILFVAEAVTFCHVTRPMVLAEAVRKSGHSAEIACTASHASLLSGSCDQFHQIHSVGSESFLANLSQGRPAFTRDQLVSSAYEDLQLLDRVRPDLVIGDMRLSLAISAREARIPYWTITNAYWSPYANQPWTIPELPVTRILGHRLANPFFRMARKPAFALHCRPFNQARQHFGQESLGHSLEAVYTEADHVLYADSPELIPTSDLPSNHHFIGPILWSTPGEMPSKWNQMDHSIPSLFVSLGSSGPADLLPEIVATLADLNPPVNVLVATSKRGTLSDSIRNLPNVLAADYLPARTVCQHASLAICHGGSASAYVALAEGTPVLGIPSILDQHLTIEYIKTRGAGEALRAEDLKPSRLAATTQNMLEDGRYNQAADAVSRSFQELNPGQSLNFLIETYTR